MSFAAFTPTMLEDDLTVITSTPSVVLATVHALRKPLRLLRI
jgi:hypothetical protein